MTDVRDSRVWYRIGDVARLLDEDTHVIRFWESELRLRAPRSAKGQRWYTEKHLAKLRLVRWLLREELYTIDGARRQLERLQGW